MICTLTINFLFIIKLSHVLKSSRMVRKLGGSLGDCLPQKLQNGMKLISQFYWDKTL